MNEFDWWGVYNTNVRMCASWAEELEMDVFAVEVGVGGIIKSNPPPEKKIP